MTARLLMSGVIRQKISRLVDQWGGVDSVAALLSDPGKTAHKGTLSKRLSGNPGWHIEDIVALEDALGEFPVTRAMLRRLQKRVEPGYGALADHAARVNLTTGLTVNAILAAQQSDADQDRATAITEIDEAIAALRRARSALEAE